MFYPNPGSSSTLQAHDAVLNTTTNLPTMVGGRAADPTSLPTPVAAGDVSYSGYSLQQEALVYKSRLDAGEDQTNGLQAVATKQVAVSTYSPGSTGATGTLPGNIKASAGVLKRVFISNFNAATRYVQVFNSAGAPSGTPLFSTTIASSGLTELIFGREGLYLSTGISIGFSTAAATYTAGAAGDVAFLVQYN